SAGRSCAHRRLGIVPDLQPLLDVLPEHHVEAEWFGNVAYRADRQRTVPVDGEHRPSTGRAAEGMERQ
ncbi:MAG TPA: hypothetical protein VHH53_07715, partial [Pseudonocardiaceae bacterium]|nr:hypothetical protein [Pseudonocardiaceae bacterium]